ncbi:MAG: TIGR04255 family protein [Rhodocyclaceae bacterium]|nr:TIGR04255 family protein [Rhodocyclaceae bacterium]
MDKIPVKLENDPIIEAIFEIRFNTEVQSAADLLPGLLFPELRKDFPRIEPLPVSQIPQVIRDRDPDLRYQPRHRLVGERSWVLLGDRSAAIACKPPYIGWTDFRRVILQLVRLLEGTKLIKEVERFSLKYINLLSGTGPAEQFSQIRFSADLAGISLVNQITQLKTELIEDDFVNIVEIMSNAVVVTEPGQTLKGMVLAIDTIRMNPKDFWSQSDYLIDRAHSTEKSIFFRSLTKETINSLKPKW